MTPTPKPEWYSRKRLLIPSLLIVPPLGLYGAWKSNRPIWKKLIYTLAGLFGAFSILVILVASFADTSKYKRNRIAKATIKSESIAQAPIPNRIAKATIKSESIAQVPVPRNFEKLKSFQKKWADSVVKDWKGAYIVSTSISANGDSIYFQLSKAASKNNTNINEANQIGLQDDIDSATKRLFGAEFSDRPIVVALLLNKQQEQENIALAERAHKIQLQFSPWDGSHRSLVRYVKDNMNDPGSFDHVETRHVDKGKYIIVQMKYRGKNALGAKIIDMVTAKVDIDGNILSIVE
ncbi:MAG: hypothetical protein EOO08_08760 [Chitinophagaceae bacterium]|nr:MAG: hypothetical protein EOO08_08760 [Chitinophagaceae bacterium]